MKGRIIQLVAPATPVFAVYNLNEDAARHTLPKSPEDLLLKPVPALALIEHRNGGQSVVGLDSCDLGEIDEIQCSNFLGYACSKEEAAVEYVREAPAPEPALLSVSAPEKP